MSAPSSSSEALPHFSSLLAPAFSEALARDFELQEEKRQQEIQCIKNKRRLQQTVKVFAWTLDGQEPIVRHFQSGFVWPFFNPSYFVLECVGLLEASNKNLLEQYDVGVYGYWSRVEVGHVIEVREGYSIFLKSSNVTCCPNFKEHLATFHSTTPLFYGKLAQEREYVRNALKTSDTWSIPSTPQKRKASSSPSISPSPSPPAAPCLQSSLIAIIEKPKSQPAPQSSSSSSSTLGTAPTLPPDEEQSVEWPCDFYVSDIVECFLDCKMSVKRGGKKT